jgi:hypothetical protein
MRVKPSSSQLARCQFPLFRASCLWQSEHFLGVLLNFSSSVFNRLRALYRILFSRPSLILQGEHVPFLVLRVSAWQLGQYFILTLFLHIPNACQRREYDILCLMKRCPSCHKNTARKKTAPIQQVCTECRRNGETIQGRWETTKKFKREAIERQLLLILEGLL